MSRRFLLRGAVLAGGLMTVSAATGRGAAARAAGRSSRAVKLTVTGWGGCDLVRDGAMDRLKLEMVAIATGTEPVKIPITELDLFGQRYTVRDVLLIGPDGFPHPYQADGALEYDGVTRQLLLATTGAPGRLEVSGLKVSPPSGEEFPGVTLVAEDQTKYVVRPSARNFHRPDYAAQRAKGPAVMAALKKFSDYMDTRRTETGWLVGSAWGEPREESQAIAGLVTGYLQYHFLSGDKAHEDQARRALDWLVANQLPNGGFGLPWAWGLANGHFGGLNYAEHYENKKDHPAGFPYSVNALNAGLALLIGYEHFRDPRYLATANRVRDFVLKSEQGFQWLDAAHTRGSIPYCNMLPLIAPGDPRLKDRHVLPSVANSSIEIYNIDAFAIKFLDRLRQITGDQTIEIYVRALVTNILFRIEADGAIDYAWIQQNRPDFYTYAVAAGLCHRAATTGDKEVFEAARRMLAWRGNAYPPGGIIAEPEGVTLFGLDNTKSAVGYCSYSVNSQKPAGDWSDGKNTRNDIDKMNAMTMIMIQAGYQEGAAAKARKAADKKKFTLLLSEPGPVMATARRKEPHPRYYP